MNVVNEWQMLFVTSCMDGFSKFFIAYSVTRSLRSIPKLVRMQKLPPVDSPSPHTIHVWCPRLERWGQSLLVAWGLFVLCLHLHATTLPDNHHCMIQVRPWLARRSACSFMEISCMDSNETSDAAGFDKIIDKVNGEWLAYLIIRHCPAVEITPRFQGLRRLIGLKLFNATLVHWGLDAAATNMHHPHLFACIIACNMTVVPPGLYHGDFPRRLTDIELSRINLTAISSELSTMWPTDLFLVLEELQLPSFPMMIAELQPAFLLVHCTQQFLHPSTGAVGERAALLCQ